MIRSSVVSKNFFPLMYQLGTKKDRSRCHHNETLSFNFYAQAQEHSNPTNHLDDDDESWGVSTWLVVEWKEWGKSECDTAARCEYFLCRLYVVLTLASLIFLRSPSVCSSTKNYWEKAPLKSKMTKTEISKKKKNSGKAASLQLLKSLCSSQAWRELAKWTSGDYFTSQFDPFHLQRLAGFTRGTSIALGVIPPRDTPATSAFSYSI